jgi:hypothetical protein
MTIFISHHHLDFSYAQKLFEDLESRGFAPWLYEMASYGVDLDKTIQEKLESSSAVIMLLSPHAAASSAFRTEIERAISLNKRIFPILLQSISKNPLQQLKYFDARDGKLPSEEFYQQLGAARMQNRMAGDVTTDAPPPEKKKKKDKGHENDYSLSQ